MSFKQRFCATQTYSEVGVDLMSTCVATSTYLQGQAKGRGAGKTKTTASYASSKSKSVSKAKSSTMTIGKHKLSTVKNIGKLKSV